IGSGKMASVAVRDALKIILMLRLGLPEIPDRLDFGDNPAGPETGRVHVRDGIERDGLLLVVGEIDRRTIARTEVVALTVQSGRVVDLEEEFQKPAVTGLRRIED